MKPANLKIFQALSDLLIPLLGYFWWNWNLYFILLFIVLDYLVFVVFSFIKIKKIQQHQGQKYVFPTKQFGLTLLLLVAGLLAIYPGMLLINPTFNVGKETWDFLAYKELGIAQGVILLPILIYGGYMQYKMQFLINNRFTTAQTTEIWRTHFTTMILVLSAAVVFWGISSVVVFQHIVYIFTLIFGVALYRFAFTRS